MTSNIKNDLVLKKVGPSLNIAFSKGFPTDIEAADPLANDIPEVLFISSYPPRECGIATYAQDLLKALGNKFGHSFSLKVCAMEAGEASYVYPEEVRYILNTQEPEQYSSLAHIINHNPRIKIVLMQHEFGFFPPAAEGDFLKLLSKLTKPVVVVFHTVLPQPNPLLLAKVQQIAAACQAIIVMTQHAAQLLEEDYAIPSSKIAVIAHGTHLVPHLDKSTLKKAYGLEGKKILSTFGLLSSGKGIDTTLEALPAIIEANPDVLFMIIGKTHPGVVAHEGEQYREMLENKVKALQLEAHVKFINQYLPLSDLLAYLQLTDIYLFTSKDPNQAVSGTFAYAMSCGCPVISTPIPHALEMLPEGSGIIVDFQNPIQLASAVNQLLADDHLRGSFAANSLQRVAPTAWENSAIAHAMLFQKVAGYHKRLRINPVHSQLSTGERIEKIRLDYQMPPIHLGHLKKMTTAFGMIQFAKINQPDIESGYTLDDNARALIAIVMHYEATFDPKDLPLIRIYLDFIEFCLQPGGQFLNYVDSDREFTQQNETVNLSDANGRAIWALGFLASKRALLPPDLFATAEAIMRQVLPAIETMYSTRAMAFAVKGLFFYNQENPAPEISRLIKTLADRLVQMYWHESEQNWHWYESYLTYANSALPEAMLCAWLELDEPTYKEIAKISFDFLLSRTFDGSGIKVISNKNWLHKGQEATPYGEQPIDVAYTILAASMFYDVFKQEIYLHKMSTAFNWFLGQNHLHQIIYNPCTGGCYDGLEENQVNLNQGAESTLSYLLALLTLKKYK